MTADPLPELGQRIEALEGDAPALAYALRRTADALRGEGELRVVALSANLEEFTERCRASELALTPVVSGCGVPRPEGQRLTSLLSQRRAWNWLSCTAEARGMLQSALRLKTSDPALDLSQPLRLTRDALRSLSEATLAENVPEELRSEAISRHPLAALVQLVQRREEFSDEDWDDRQTRVRSAFGPALAIAAVRGRLDCN